MALETPSEALTCLSVGRGTLGKCAQEVNFEVKHTTCVVTIRDLAFIQLFDAGLQSKSMQIINRFPPSQFLLATLRILLQISFVFTYRISDVSMSNYSFDDI